MSEVTYFILYILQHNKERHQPFWSDPLNPIFCLSLNFLSGDAPFSPCAGATLACAGRGTYGGPILCLCRHLLILSNASHSHILCFSHPRSVLGCAWSSWGQSIHTAWVGVHSEVVMGIHNQYYQITLNGA